MSSKNCVSVSYSYRPQSTSTFENWLGKYYEPTYDPWFYPTTSSSTYFYNNWYSMTNSPHEVEVPGFNHSTLSIEVENGYLTVTGENNKRSINKKLLLPTNVDVNTIKATCNDGILTITWETKNTKITVTQG